MNFPRIISAAVTGTSAMTLFSYWMSAQKGQNFKEPELLTKMIISIRPRTGRYGSRIAGWIIHYLVGIFFACLYKMWFKKNRSGPVLPEYVVIGAATGIIGVIGWQVTLMLHPYPPMLDRKRFYGQLVIAHCIFGVVTLYLLDQEAHRCLPIKVPIPHWGHHPLEDHYTE